MNIKQHRLRLKLTQEELGEKVGMTQSQISKIERNGTDSVEKLKLFAEVFKIPIEELIKEESCD